MIKPFIEAIETAEKLSFPYDSLPQRLKSLNRVPLTAQLKLRLSKIVAIMTSAASSAPGAPIASHFARLVWELPFFDLPATLRVAIPNCWCFGAF